MSADACAHLRDGGRQKCVGRQKAICSEKEDQAQDFTCDIETLRSVAGMTCAAADSGVGGPVRCDEED